MAEAEAKKEPKKSKLWEDAVHVIINEKAPAFVNWALDKMPKDMYEKLMQSSDWVEKVLPWLSGAILHFTNNATWADSLVVTGMARIREEVGKRAKGEKVTGETGEKHAVKTGHTIRELLLIADKANIDAVLARIGSLSEDKRNKLLNTMVAVAKKDKIDAVIANLATCEVSLFVNFVDLLLLGHEEPEPEQISFMEELLDCPQFIEYFFTLQKETKATIKRHLEHIPFARRRDRLQSLNSGTYDEFLAYVDAVLLTRDYYDFDKLLPGFINHIKESVYTVHEKRKQRGGFFAGFQRGLKKGYNKRR